MDSLATKFQQIYANLPLNQRREVVVVLGDEPLSWNAAKIEIDSNTEKAKESLCFMLSTKASQEQKDAIPYLWSNRKSQVILGDDTAHI